LQGNDVRAYRELWSHRDARWPLALSTLARITPGMIVLALVLALREGAYSFTAAGLVTGAHQVGVGLGSPLQGTLVDRFGQRRLLVPDAVLYLGGTIGLAAFIAMGSPVPLLVVVAVLAGLVYPPTTACSRVLMSGLFPSGQLRETAFAVTAIAIEIGFIVGPLAAVVIAEFIPAGWSIVMAGLFAAVGSVGYALTAAVQRVPRRDPTVARGGALRSAGVRIMTVALGTIAFVFGVVDIVVPAVGEASDVRFASGLLIAAIASGSLLGGLVYGGRSWPGTLVGRLRFLAAVFTVGLLLIPLSLGSVPAFAVALFLGGIFLGPTTICAFQLIDDLALPGTQTEAQSWTQSSVVVGVALGAVMSGAAVDAGRSAGAFVLGAASVGLAVLLIHLRHATLRQAIRGSDALPTPSI
jgi:MFS family permease